MESNMNIIWSAKAKTTFYLVIDYLHDNWTKKEVVRFYDKTQITLNAIKKNPGIFSVSAKNNNIRKARVDKNNSFYYKIDNYHKNIYLLTFFDSRQDHQKLLL